MNRDGFMTTNANNKKFKYSVYSKKENNRIKLEYGLAYSMEIIGLILTGYSFIHKSSQLISRHK